MTETPTLPRSGAGAVDAHVHVWDPARHRHDWLSEPDTLPLRRAFGLDDYRRAAERGVAGHPVEQIVLVQALAEQRESADLLALAADHGDVAVIGWVDLTGAGVQEQIRELSEGAGGSRLVGLRHLAQQEPASWFEQPTVAQGLSLVASAGLPYDLLIRSGQLDAAERLVAAVPELTVVLDHAAKPAVAAGLRSWRAGIARLATHPAVHCKLSGLMTENPGTPGRPPTLATLQPVMDALLHEFGPTRLLFGSDWPVCVLAGGFDEWNGLVEGLLAPLSAVERDQILAGNARRVYRLPESAVPSPTLSEARC